MVDILESFVPRLREARPSDRVYRDECMFSFDSSFSPDGLYTNLSSFQSFGANFLTLDRMRNPKSLYLLQKAIRVKKIADQAQEIAPTKLAIGGEGGFATSGDKFDVHTEYYVVAFDEQNKELSHSLNDSLIPQKIKDVVTSILNHKGNKVEEAVTSWQEELKESIFSENLIQLPNPPKISSSPSAWKCQAENCDKQENLWLNLSDGFIGCGRQNWDGTGGCGEALRHFEETGRQYPLAVKLGTITAEGGDVFSYEEDDLVTNKNLAKHLTHFGIHVNNLKKTDKSMNELQVDLNLHYEFDTILESGKKLLPVSGAGYIGFKNLGNSCYMNSVLQLLFALPEVQNRYLEAADQIFQTSPSNVAEDFPTQMAKLACAALSNRYKRLIVNGVEDEDAKLKQIDLCPSTFRGLVGKDHPDFSTGQQQDAIEYFQYLIDYMNRSERVASNRIGALIEGSDVSLPTSSLFKFCFEDRVQCLQSNKVKYVSREDCFLQLQIPVEQATNSSQVKEYQVREEQKRQKLEQDGADHGSPQKDKDDKVVPIVPFETCIEKTLAPEVIEEFLSPATGKKGLAEKTIRFKTFPRYLLVQMRRFYVAEDWSPKKLDVSVPVPESFSLHNYQSVGLQAGEETLPETAATVVGSLSTSSSISESNVITPDETLVAQLISMGFSENGCKRAAIATSNGTAEAAMEWIFSHMEDPDFNDPLVVADENANRSPNSETYNMEHVSALMAMSFTQEQAQCALAQTSHNPDRAAEWLFSRMDDLDGVVAAWKSRQSSNAGGSSGDSSTHGLDSNCASGEYQLVGFISHIGKNTHSGHYVCHIKKNDKWIIFNDDTVAYSEEPPFSAGYLYLFRRKDKK